MTTNFRLLKVASAELYLPPPLDGYKLKNDQCAKTKVFWTRLSTLYRSQIALVRSQIMIFLQRKVIFLRDLLPKYDLYLMKR